MKKTILKTLAATLFLGVVFSSCLGDNNSKIENSNALAYIKTTEYGVGKVALTNLVSFSHDYVNTLTAKEFYFLDFSINTKDGMNRDGSYIARNVSPSPGNGEPVVSGRYMPETPNENPDIYPTQMNVSLFSPYQITVDDKWVFAYECLAYEEDTYEDFYTKRNNIRLVATILKKDQDLGSEEGSKPLGDNKVIIRLYLERGDREIKDPSKGKIPHRGVASVDLTAVRHELENIMQGGKDNTLGIIQFKYLMQKNKDGEIKDEALGSLNEERPDFYMVIGGE